MEKLMNTSKFYYQKQKVSYSDFYISVFVIKTAYNIIEF